MSSTSTTLRVGILTADEGAKAIQAIYLPALRALPTSFQVQAIHDGSKQPLSYETDINGNICNDHDHHQQQHGMSTSTSTTIPVAPTPDDILSNPTINLILNFMPNEYHETYTIAALHSGKHVMVETPLSLSIPSAKRIIEAEKHAPNGAKVFVACARRYAPSIASVFRQEVASLDRIYYARCRNIAGPSSAHTATAPRKQVWNEVNGHGQPFPISPPSSPSDSMTGKTRPQLLQGLLEEAFLGQDLSKERVALCEFLASLGCHDLGLVRDTLGYPDAVSSISVNEPYYSAVFHYYSGGKSEHAFTLMYETGTDAVPRCDAHLTIYGDTKTVSVQYGLPYGRRHGVKVVVETVDENGEMKRSETVSAWEESYREELKALHAYLTEDRAVKTTAKDAIQDLRLFQTIFEQYDRQCGTIRTPLG
ncbi:NAD binding Rossmann fold oxidoreductase [Aspergillus costaricaensis CBS 115574]|uniref:NAD binding Rossmann fold oxidoreductase n=1 Tax=Aspergillus costaricaensis CBS 115574 TaxID=1448317 RepID=A0ACD1IEK4_9EURO|nr:NAD binding Rossmann fold oxidoreductase [Aspergillus costaricaensis CBS 115574]RAK88447.1 NAD binding Rossmann fold oxidoreductase [Aspergillus costaricaensis CBS 115574]